MIIFLLEGTYIYIYIYESNNNKNLNKIDWIKIIQEIYNLFKIILKSILIQIC